MTEKVEKVEKTRTKIEIAKEPSICLIRGCGVVVKSRGLCSQHYAIARGRVAAGTGTWAQFEKLGLALASTSGPTGLRTQQFDSAFAEALKRA